MKKTLMALCLAFCATAVFAQTNNVSLKGKTMDRQVSRNGEIKNVDQAAYKASIFTKSGELYINTFATEPTTGTLTSNDQVNGTAAIGHSQTAYHSQWHRIADTTNATNIAMSNGGQYPVTFDGTDYGFNLIHNLYSATPMDGFMLMTMQDQIAGWGGHGNAGNFNAYIAFPAFSTTGANGIDVKINQYYRKFNYDQCWIDYSTNGTTWSAVEFNVRNIDVSTNNSLRGWVMKCMPTSLGNQANVYLRLRWECSSNGGGAYGYFWLLDDFTVEALPAERLTVNTAEYYEGFYHLMPQGLQLPVVWNSTFQNTGVNSLNNVTGKVMTYAGNAAATEIAHHNAGNFAMGESGTTAIDPLGFWGSDPDYHFGYMEDAQITSGTLGTIPTDNTGRVYTYADITTATMSHVQLDSTHATFDTNVVIVNNGDRNIRTWGRDNGVLSKFSYWTAGQVEENVWSSDPDEIDWSSESYAVMCNYVTGDQVPAGWRIKGVEIVASTYPGYCEPGAKISPMLYWDSCEGTSVWFKNVETGAGTHTITANELNLAGVENSDPNESLTYETFGDYNTVVIEFPDQPELLPHKNYNIGYILAEDGFFCAAENHTYYYDPADSTGIYYRETPGMTDFSHTFGLNNSYSTLVYEPYDNNFHWYPMSAYPMIRMLVGPYEQYNKYPVHFECGDNGMIYNSEYEELCGLVDSCVEHSSHTYIVTPDEDYSVATIVVNGEEVFNLEEEDEEDYHRAEINFPINDINNAVEVSATFVYDPDPNQGSINFADGVEMNLQPNPATSNVQLTIAGVEGMVNFALIDMSGRVISAKTIDAAVAQNINVSNLAKGAYFVRITNNNMSKVEKLIVR